MPVATLPFSSRRQADSLISRAYGAQGCAVHSPSAERPGPIATHLAEAFRAHGYSLATAGFQPGQSPALVEVFPHPAILTLLQESYRFPYKAANARKYWPQLSAENRRGKLLANYDLLLAALREWIGGIDFALPGAADRPRPALLKRYEDALDALVCCWVGMRYLDGCAQPYGDETAAIWCPTVEGGSGVSS